MKFRFSIVIFLFLCHFLSNAQEIKVISSTSSSVVFEYTPLITDTMFVSHQNQNFVKLSISNIASQYDYSKDVFHLPQREVNIGVKQQFGNTVSIVSVETSTLNGILLPFTDIELNLDERDLDKIWADDEFIDYATPGEFGLVRNLAIQSLKLIPVYFNPETKQITVIKKMVVRVSIAGESEKNFSKVDNRLNTAVLNFDQAKNWGISSERNTSLRKVESSVLANGIWYRFECPEEGIYMIDRAMLSNYGIDAASVDPRTIKIFNKGGYQLPEDIDESIQHDLAEVAIYVSGEDDGSFDNGDYILFYGRGTEFWEYSSARREITRVKNQFSRKNYFWITSGGNSGKRMEVIASLNESNYVNQNTSLCFKYNDNDIINIGGTGRDWLGDKFTPNSPMKTYVTTLEGVIQDSVINYNFRLVNASESTIPLTISENNNQIYARNMSRIYSDYTVGVQLVGTAIYEGALSDSRSNLKFGVSSVGDADEVYLDYFEIEYWKELRAYNDSLLFFSNKTNGVVRYSLYNFSNSDIKVFDITDYANVKTVTNASISGGEYIFQAEESSSKQSKYYAFTASAYKTPVRIEQVGNSDISGITGGAEFIIITHPNFAQQANELSNYRSSVSSHKVSSLVIDVDYIYNEFSGGSMDPGAIRDFIRHAYDTWSVRPYYVLFFGDGDYDYYNIEGNGKNFIPSYQTINSLHEINSYPSDDFYARISGSDDKVDVAIGRFNVQTVEEAERVVTKIKEYEADPERNLWKNTLTLVADDGPTTQVDDGSRHTAQSETLANSIIPDYLVKNKIYLAAYPTVITGSGRRKPEVNRAIIDAVNQGTLMLNFIGHGDPETWAHENVFTTDISIPQLQNDKYFFLTAATCDYGKYDQTTEQSAAEIMVLMEHGAIGALTAVRPVYSSLNAALNEAFYKNLFDNSANQGHCLGDAFMLTKQVKTGDNDEKFHLFGDPTLRLNMPTVPIAIDSVNGTSLQATVQIKALDQVNIKGRVTDANGNLVNMNGEGIITVYDSDKIIQLPEMSYQMTVQGGIIFKGRTAVENGYYDLSFVVPKDISYADNNGRIIAYIYNDDEDGLGFSKNVIVGGTNENVVNDGAGPEIEVFYDDFQFDNSYIVNQDFTLLVKLNDETGLNTTGTGVGHKLEGIIDDNYEQPIDFSSYFVGDLDAGGKSGNIEYRFTSQSIGEHNLKIKAWDVFNNQSIVESYFSVINTDGLAVENVVNYPNPFKGNTTFTFQHNLDAAVNVNIKIYTIAGRLIKEIEEYNMFEKFVRIDWDGRDEDGNLAANGTYLYKVNVETIDGEYNKNVLGKLSIIR